jgi:two-component system, chemotaxis family, sensor kinase CheA
VTKDRKIIFSMRLKIILLLVILILFSLGSYLFFAIDLFVQDKTVYLYDSSLNTLKTYSESLQGLYDISETKSAEIIRKYNINNNLDSNVFENEKNILAFVVRDDENITVYNNSNIFEETKNLFSLKADYLEKSQFKEYLFSEQKEQIEKINLTQKLAFPSIGISIKSSLNTRRYIIVLSLANYLKELKSDKSFDRYLLNTNLESIINSSDNGAAASKELYVQEFQKNKVDRGVKEVIDGKGNEKIAAYIRLPNLGLLLVSEILKDKAFAITSVLIQKSSVAAIFLTTLAILLGIIFSSTLTKPISLLVEGTKEVANKNYNSLVKVNTSDELGILSDSFNFMGQEISRQIQELEEAKAQLENYSQNLEEMVKVRTAELKKANDFLDAMINSLDQGLMVFDQSNICHETYTTACERLFDKKPAHLNFFEVLGVHDQEKVELYKRWSTNLFKEIIPFEHLAVLGPKNVTNNDDFHSEDFKYISLDYFPMRNEDRKIENIVAVATDKTNEIKAQRSFEEKEAQAQMIVKLVENKRQFLSFIEEFKNYLYQMKRSFKDEIQYEKILGALHSIKGGAGLFSMKKIAEMTHHFEEEVLSIRKSKTMGDASIKERLEEIYRELDGSLHLFLTQSKNILGDVIDDGDYRFEVRKSTVINFYQAAMKLSKEKVLELFEEEFYKEPLIEGIKSYANLVKDLSQKFAKDINPVIFEGCHLRIVLSDYSSFFSSLVHVFRNSVDHGIEDPEKRELLGKPRAGTIKVKCIKTIEDGIDMLTLEIEDDGGGIDPERVRQKMIKLGLEEAAKTHEDSSVIYYIFSDFFSTKEETSETSGRGVGMSAVKDEIEKREGSLKVESKVNIGTKFTFSIPFIKRSIC